MRLAIACLLFVASACLADTITLSNGTTVEGKVVSTNDDEVTVSTDYHLMHFSPANVKSIRVRPAVELSYFHEPVSFTNHNGIFETNVEPVNVTSNKLVYRTASGWRLDIWLCDLPVNLEERFGYDPAKAPGDSMREVEEKQASKRSMDDRDRKSQEAANDAGFAREDERAMLKGATIVNGHVIQKIDAGLIVEATGWYDNQARFEWDARYKAIYMQGRREGWKPGTVTGWVLLTGYAGYFVDGQLVTAMAIPAGTYTYDTVAGSTKTIPKYRVY